MDLGPHAIFILAAYAVTAGVLIGLVGWLLIDGRQQKRLVDELEARYGRRRSGKTKAES